ncbi:MAG: hypothetical protein KDB46_02305 [Solirubrobacterales bacterium]|nr:hypothetical protein [Solirubrobacterales bacterium]
MKRWASLAVLAVLSTAPATAGCGGEDETATAPASFYGVAPEGLQSPADYARMRTGNLGTVRVVLQWSAIETSAGHYSWSGSDQLLSQLTVAGLDPLVTVYGTPAVYAPNTSDAPTGEKVLDAWVAFLKAAVARYGTGGDFWTVFETANPETATRPIAEWEIWNEPNSSTFWSPTPDPKAYGELLQRSAEVIHASDPEAEVMSAGMFATPQSDGAIVSYDFLRDMFDVDGLENAVDIVGIHPYGPDADSVIAQVEKTRKTLDGVSDGTPMWATEIGWGSNPKSGAELAKTPEEQADLLAETFGELADRRDEFGLDGVVWYTWHDSIEKAIGECGWCASAGLVDADRDTKPSWTAYTDLTGGTP